MSEKSFINQFLFAIFHLSGYSMLIFLRQEYFTSLGLSSLDLSEFLLTSDNVTSVEILPLYPPSLAFFQISEKVAICVLYLTGFPFPAVFMIYNIFYSLFYLSGRRSHCSGIPEEYRTTESFEEIHYLHSPNLVTLKNNFYKNFQNFPRIFTIFPISENRAKYRFII